MFWSKYLVLEERFCKALRRYVPILMRISLGIIFLWFGGMKVFGISPVEELVYRATHWLGVHNFVIILGVWELLIGICFLFKKLNRLAILLFFLQIPGTFIPLFTNPEDCFTIIPYGLTLEGQYIVKNIILISGVLFVLSRLRD